MQILVGGRKHGLLIAMTSLKLARALSPRQTPHLSPQLLSVLIVNPCPFSASITTLCFFQPIALLVSRSISSLARDLCDHFVNSKRVVLILLKLHRSFPLICNLVAFEAILGFP